MKAGRRVCPVRHKATAPPVAVAAFGAWSKRAWLDLPTDVKISRVLFRKIAALLAVGVRVVAVFDGPPPKLKAQRRAREAAEGLAAQATRPPDPSELPYSQGGQSRPYGQRTYHS